MARLDDEAKPILSRLLDTLSSMELTADESRVLATWAFKVAIAFEYVGGSSPSSPLVRDRFFRTRTVPEHAAVALGMVSFTYANNLFAVHTGTLAGTAVDVRSCTILLKHLIIQVAYYPAGNRIFDPIDCLALRNGGRTLLHPSRHPSSWPPLRVVDSEIVLRGVAMGLVPFPDEVADAPSVSPRRGSNVNLGLS